MQLNQSAENVFYDHPRDPIFPLQGALKAPQPLFKMGQIEYNSDMIIGIPTIKASLTKVFQKIFFN